jgi:hypothetical protein
MIILLAKIGKYVIMADKRVSSQLMEGLGYNNQAKDIC